MKDELVPGRCKECPHCRKLTRASKPPNPRVEVSPEEFIRALFLYDDSRRIGRALGMTPNAVRVRAAWLRKKGVNLPPKRGPKPTNVVNLNKLVKELTEERATGRLRNPNSGDEAGDKGPGLCAKVA